MIDTKIPFAAALAPEHGKSADAQKQVIDAASSGFVFCCKTS